jgi:hypothetical protein
MEAAEATSYITKQQSPGEKKNQEVKELFYSALRVKWRYKLSSIASKERKEK